MISYAGASDYTFNNPNLHHAIRHCNRLTNFNVVFSSPRLLMNNGNYQHILLAVDFSEHGNHVARKAAHLAELFRAKLSMIHVLDNIPMPDTAYGTTIAPDEYSTNELLEAEKFKLKQIGDRLNVDPTRRWMVWGVPGQEIVRMAEREHIDLIVVGSHGRHGLALLLGSTASNVLHHAGCDVLAMRLHDEAAHERPSEEVAFNPQG